MPRPKSLIVKKYAFTLHITGALREHLKAAAYVENRSQVNLATHILETSLAEKWPNADIEASNKAYKIKIADPAPAAQALTHPDAVRMWKDYIPPEKRDK